MARVEKSIEVQAPLRSVYNQWTQFEEFPQFMEGVRQVDQLDDTHLHWAAKVGGKDLEWDAEIIEQVPDRRIAWHSVTGKKNAGTVQFQPAEGDCTRVSLSMEYDPQGLIENIGDAIGVLSRRVESDLERFKAFMEARGEETGAWRGEVRGARTTAGAERANEADRFYGADPLASGLDQKALDQKSFTFEDPDVPGTGLPRSRR